MAAISSLFQSNRKPPATLCLAKPPFNLLIVDPIDLTAGHQATRARFLVPHSNIAPPARPFLACETLRLRTSRLAVQLHDPSPWRCGRRPRMIDPSGFQTRFHIGPGRLVHSPIPRLQLTQTEDLRGAKVTSLFNGWARRRGSGRSCFTHSAQDGFARCSILLLPD